MSPLHSGFETPSGDTWKKTPNFEHDQASRQDLNCHEYFDSDEIARQDSLCPLVESLVQCDDVELQRVVAIVEWFTKLKPTRKAILRDLIVGGMGVSELAGKPSAKARFRFCSPSRD
jgi:hypothetical protein